jgi:hypothetical protein
MPEEYHYPKPAKGNTVPFRRARSEKMKPLWTGAALLLWAGLVPAQAVPDHCPPVKPVMAKAVHKPVHHHRHHRAQPPHYYEDEYVPAPPPPPLPPPPPPPRHVWHDGYGKAYVLGPRPWGPPPPCPCPPDHEGRLPGICQFDVWHGFDPHYGLESGL